MRKKLTLLYCLFLTTILFAQKELPAFGKVDIADLRMQSCSFEPDAPAMKLFDVQETEFDLFTFSTQLKTERRVRIKIFNEKGYKSATIRIPYLSKKGIAKIKELTGIVYNIDAGGKISVQKLEKKDFFKEKAIENVGIVNFTFPNLRPGSIIEYRYTTIENNIVYITPWLIQDNIPVLYTSRTVITPVESKIFERPYGVDTIQQVLDLLKHDRHRRITYFMENIVSFKPEPFMSSINDHLIRASFLLFPAGGYAFRNYKGSSDIVWKAAGSQFLKSNYFQEQVIKSIAGTEKIIDSAKKITSVEERIGYLYSEVKKRMPDKVEQTMNAENLTEAWENKTGNSAEINLILLNILDKANVKCLPVFVSTRENGKINKDFPSFGQLNGIDVLAMDSSNFFILDASLKFQSFQNPPLNILNREAFVVSPDSTQWVTITDDRPLLKQVAFVMADMNEEGKMEGSGSIQYYDYAKAYKLDTTLKDENKTDEAFYDKKPAGLKIISTKQELPGNDLDPLFETVEFIYEPQKTDDFLFINPRILTERNKNPFVAEKRNTDLDFGCNQLFIMTMQIHMPATFQMEYLPKNITVRAPDSSFFYKRAYSFKDQTVFISQSFESKRSLYSKDEYPGIQDFFKQMYALMAEEIILKKKK